MSMYVLQVLTGQEKTVTDALVRNSIPAMVPITEMYIRKSGKWISQERLLFSGYVFVQVDMTPEMYYRIHETPYIIRFLGGGCPQALSEAEKEFIMLLCYKGKPLPAAEVKSGAAYIGRQRIPGKVTQLRKRQRRIKMEIDILGKSHEVFLSYK